MANYRTTASIRRRAVRDHTRWILGCVIQGWNLRWMLILCRVSSRLCHDSCPISCCILYEPLARTIGQIFWKDNERTQNWEQCTADGMPKRWNEWIGPNIQLQQGVKRKGYGRNYYFIGGKYVNCKLHAYCLHRYYLLLLCMNTIFITALSFILKI